MDKNNVGIRIWIGIKKVDPYAGQTQNTLAQWPFLGSCVSFPLGYIAYSGQKTGPEVAHVKDKMLKWIDAYENTAWDYTYVLMNKNNWWLLGQKSLLEGSTIS